MIFCHVIISFVTYNDATLSRCCFFFVKIRIDVDNLPVDLYFRFHNNAGRYNIMVLIEWEFEFIINAKVHVITGCVLNNFIPAIRRGWETNAATGC